MAEATMHSEGVILTYFMASMMILVGVLGMDSVWGNYSGTFKDLMIIFSKAVLIVLGLVILLLPNKSNMTAIGIYAIALGAGRVLRSLYQIVASSEMMFNFGLVMMCLGFSLSLCGLSYLKGVSKNTTRMLLITGSIVVGYVVYILFALHWGDTLENIVLRDRDIISIIILYLAFVIVLASKEVHNNIPIEKIRASLKRMSYSAVTEDGLSISADDLKSIVNGMSDRSSWKMSDGHLPVESEILVSFMSKEGARDVVVQKWKGDDGLYVAMVNDAGGSFVRGFRTHVLYIVPDSGSLDDCTHVEFRDDNGASVTLDVIRGDANDF